MDSLLASPQICNETHIFDHENLLSPATLGGDALQHGVEERGEGEPLSGVAVPTLS